MLDRSELIQSLLLGCLACLVLTSVVNADGRVFVLELRNSSGLRGFRDAEQACASHHARLASAAELRHAVVECFFSECTRGWLYGGSVGTTVCNFVGSTLKAVDVRIGNATQGAAHLDAFCIKDKGNPCGDPPSFPNTRLQEHSGLQMGDELLYTCAPGYVMPSGHTAFTLLCDSCGEWYGLVQLCVKDKTSESHTDYEDKLSDPYAEADSNESPEEAHGAASEEAHGAAYPDVKRSQDTSFDVKAQQKFRGKLINRGGKSEVDVHDGQKNERLPVEDIISHRMWEHERSEEDRTESDEATEPPVSVLSQKHLFWFPSEAFQEEGPPASTNTATQTTQRTSGTQSEESKEHESQEMLNHQHPVDFDDHDDGQDDNDDDHHQDFHEDPDDPDDPDSFEDEDHDELDRVNSRENDDDHDDHYDMGEQEEDHDHVRFGSKEYDEHKSPEDHEEQVSEEHPDLDDHDDAEERYGLDKDDGHHFTDHDDDHEQRYEDHDSREDDDSHQHVIFSMSNDKHQNITQKGVKGKPMKDDTWLDGYPVIPDNGDSTTQTPDDRKRGPTERPNEVESHRLVPHTRTPKSHESSTLVPELKDGVLEEVWHHFPPASENLEPSDSQMYPDTLDDDSQPTAPTDSWLDDITKHPYLDHGPAPPIHSLPGEAGERGEVEGEMGEAICTEENCPPHPPSTSSHGPIVAVIIVAICAIATAVMVGVWCYRRQQKSTMYEMNGKGQSQTPQGQQIEMHQKV
ncbi:uncharacterized protein susd5 [Pholidichthys leucotaenia]